MKSQKIEAQSNRGANYCILKESNNNLRGICTRISQCSSAKNNLEMFKPNAGNICYWDNLGVYIKILALLKKKTLF